MIELNEAPVDDDLVRAPYRMRLSRLTIDKLGVKLYDRASAVVAELIANSYDADAEKVTVTLPLGTALATKDEGGEVIDGGWTLTVSDDGHGMDPSEAQRYFLSVGSDRRTRAVAGSRSRKKQRPVMGRKGIGKLAPFGICKRIEVRSAGGPLTDNGYRVSHFILDFDTIVRDEDGDVPVSAGSDDQTWDAKSGTTVVLSDFLPKRVPNREIFGRQVSRRFALARTDFTIHVVDLRAGDDAGSDAEFDIAKFQVEVNEGTRIDVANRPVPYDDMALPVTGWLAFGKQAIRDEEEAGVRIYARGKIVATTRDFEQPAGFTGEFTMRSYLVGEIHAEWLDEDDTEDLVRTDRQGILWDSEYGEALRAWGAALVKEIAKASAGPRREGKTKIFLRNSALEKRARERYGENPAVISAVLEFGSKLGGLAHEDELEDQDYIDDLTDIVLLVGPHQALIRSFQAIARLEDKTVEQLIPLFTHTRTAELASYAQIASERVDAVEELKQVLAKDDVVEADLQQLISGAPWLIRPDWSVISENQALKTFRDRFAAFWKQHYGEEIDIAISYERKRPDFTLVHLGRQLHVVELKKPGHDFGDADYGRLENYLEAFEQFFEEHKALGANFPDGWVIDLIADGINIRDTTKRRAFGSAATSGQVVRRTWSDFLGAAVVAHEQFLDAHDEARKVVNTENSQISSS
ncbi:ATP-binding protein [Labedella phragmitis]|uniref:ATP-binding protein n=1 Tax=Labedella phragmitis TaxID=2498849 RepID=A0A444PPA1_9MICO|nr:ATP-binding protein [Labedella phragmitis]RWZ46146.1 ATP-binding protein [Labedella phragmitis]